MKKLLYKYQSDSEFKQKAHIGGGIAAFLVIVYLFQTTAEMVTREPIPVVYKTDITDILGDEENPFQEEGLKMQLQELQEKYKKGARNYDSKLNDLNSRIGSLSDQNERLNEEKLAAFRKAEEQFTEKLDILDAQYRQRHDDTLSGIMSPAQGETLIGSQEIDNRTLPAPAAGIPSNDIPQIKPIELTEFERMMQAYKMKMDQDRALSLSGNSEEGGGGVDGAPYSGETKSSSLSLSIVSSRGNQEVTRLGKIDYVPDVKRQIEDEEEERIKREEEERAEQLAKDEKPKQVLPAGSLISGILINGVFAPTQSDQAKGENPVLMRIKDQAIGPNRTRVNIKDCLIIGSAVGKLNTGRAIIRARTISCVNKDGGAVEVGINAYAVGDDGQEGVKGRIISRNDRVLVNSTISGMLSGFAEALAPSEVPVLFDQGDDNKLYQQARFQDVGALAGYNGASKAFKDIASYYQELLSDLKPVIEISPGEKIEMIMMSGVEIAI